jgi:hypothetical protein
VSNSTTSVSFRFVAALASFVDFRFFLDAISGSVVMELPFCVFDAKNSIVKIVPTICRSDGVH